MEDERSEEEMKRVERLDRTKFQRRQNAQGEHPSDSGHSLPMVVELRLGFSCMGVLAPFFLATR